MYFCGNCGKVFKTGKFSEDDWEGYDEVCPDCGAYPPDSFWWWLGHFPMMIKLRLKRLKQVRTWKKNHKK